jgi:hypothetical protein
MVIGPLAPTDEPAGLASSPKDPTIFGVTATVRGGTGRITFAVGHTINGEAGFTDAVANRFVAKAIARVPACQSHLLGR